MGPVVQDHTATLEEKAKKKLSVTAVISEIDRNCGYKEFGQNFEINTCESLDLFWVAIVSAWVTSAYHSKFLSPGHYCNRDFLDGSQMSTENEKFTVNIRLVNAATTKPLLEIPEGK
ncbi:hypothetical protein WISP_91610 [Willisornis vidua]|uniref:Uncharacterized protein n=1 Tax=Willisornis vidua TaxID=1566151 RepID=A0ABQ9D1B1_9PASS|nr:hypothetical protein WISP_91610 [Willisornis vidua]